MATVIRNGQVVNLSTSEVAYELSITSDRTATGPVTLAITLVSGTCQATVAPAARAPIIDATYASWSTAGDKILLTIDPGVSTLRMRCASAGVVNVNW